jgi:uracil-DNA glycosylase
MNKKKFWIDIVGEEWHGAFPGLWESPYTGKVMEHIMKLYQSTTVYPESKDLFKPFKLCDYNSLKVIILGDYPSPKGISTGLAYANSDETLQLTAKLTKIQNAVEMDVYDGMNMGFDVTLESWAKQGVLLLNRSLTIEKFKPDEPHYHIWKKFIQGLVLAINLYNNGVHFVFWGKEAQQYSQLVLQEKDKGNYIHCFDSLDKAKWECTNFSEINNKLKQKITW